MNPDSVISRQKLENAIDNAVTITSRNFIKFQDSRPAFITVNGIYPYLGSISKSVPTHDSFWGFWSGIIWLLYELTGKSYLKCYGERHCVQIYNSINENMFNHSNHGFHVIPTCVPDMRKSQSEISRKTIISAAESLVANYNASANVICSDISELGRDTLCGMISNLINNRVLNFAYELTNDDKYIRVAENDSKTIIETNITSDGMVYFRRYFDSKTGHKLSNRGELTYLPDNGMKTRSYAWALLGLAINYSYTKNPFYAQKFSTVFDFIKSHEKNHNFINKRINHQEKTTPDSTSSAIIAAALTEFLNNDDIKDQKYCDTLSAIMNMLIDEYGITPDSRSEGLISGGYMEKNHSDNQSVIMGDYFYFETLLNLYQKRLSYWYTSDFKCK